MRLLLAVAASALALVLPAGAQGATQTFAFTGGSQAWTVPAGVTSASFDLSGAQGGGFAGGKGARVQATVAVTPGSTFLIYVGGGGQATIAPGFNGGGSAGGVGGVGGGATDVRRGPFSLADRVLVAGAGGGGSSGGNSGGNSGADAVQGGKTGTATAGGAGGASLGGGAGTPGQLGQGGAGGGGYGGGGGGGLYGGGGGGSGLGYGLGGGGGSSLVSAGGSLTDGSHSGDGVATVTYTVPPPTAVPPAPTAVPPAPTGVPPAPAAVVSFQTAPKSLRVSKTGRFTYKFLATPLSSGKVGFKSTKKVKIGSTKRFMKIGPKTFKAAATAKVKVKFKLSRKNLRALKRKHAIRFEVTATLGGKKFTAKLKLKAPRKH